MHKLFALTIIFLFSDTMAALPDCQDCLLQEQEGIIRRLEEFGRKLEMMNDKLNNIVASPHNVLGKQYCLNSFDMSNMLTFLLENG